MSKLLKKKGIVVIQVGLDGVQSDEEQETEQPPATITKKPRTTTRCLDVQALLPKERIEVVVNRFSQPIGPSGTSFRQYLGTVARNGNLCPLNYADWRDMPAQTKNDQIKYIKCKYKYPDSVGSFINKSLAAKWRGYKCRLKKKYFKSNESETLNCSRIPPNVSPQQWHFLVKHFLSPDGKRLSTIGTKSRLVLKANHTLGSKSFANRIDEMEQASGKIVGAVDFYEASRTNKNGKISNVDAANIVKKAKDVMEEYKTENPNASIEELNIKQQEVMTEIRGKEVSGRVRGLGLGPTPTMVGMLAQASSNNPNGEVDSLKKRVVELEGRLSRMAELEVEWVQFMRSFKEPDRHVCLEDPLAHNSYQSAEGSQSLTSSSSDHGYAANDIPIPNEFISTSRDCIEIDDGGNQVQFSEYLS